MSSLEVRLRKLEQKRSLKKGIEISIFRVGNHESCTHLSEEELNKELENPKYKNAIIIRDLDYWID